MEYNLECENIIDTWNMKYKNVYISIWDKMQINAWNNDHALSHITKIT